MNFVEDSDEELFMVPDMEVGSEEKVKMIDNTQESLQSSKNNNNGNFGDEEGPPKRRRGRNPVDKEYRRIKRFVFFLKLSCLRVCDRKTCLYNHFIFLINYINKIIRERFKVLS